MLAALALAVALQAAPLPAPPLAPSPPPRRGRNLPPSANLGLLFTADDYPAAALAAGEEGRVGFRLVIGADGRVTACTVTESSGSAPLDAATCRIVQLRALYAPATDRRGRPVAGTDRGSVTWRFPEDPDEEELEPPREPPAQAGGRPPRRRD